ncbi:hypothetical protein [Escherichia coli]|uniref:hypothetical protein n=1 Tax=Escherichia coli TaxID=562 RepID=UPI000A189DA6|nr:hypothetical protein [Escherichia coli]OSL84483.1 hypothetical protein EBAG_04849 [Escherichia coli T426]
MAPVDGVASETSIATYTAGGGGVAAFTAVATKNVSVIGDCQINTVDGDIATPAWTALA